MVRSRPGAAAFTSEPARLVVDVLVPDTLYILVSRRRARVEILAGGRTVFLVRRGRGTASRPADWHDPYSLPLGLPAS